MVTDTPLRQKAEEAGTEDGDDRKLAVLFRGTTSPDGEFADQSGGGGGADDPLQRTPEHVREGAIEEYSSRRGHHDDDGIANIIASVINRVETDRLRSEA